MLTPRMADTLDYIRKYQHLNRGISPSMRDIGTELGIRSMSRISELLKALEERGHITRLPNRARAIKVIQENER